MDKQIQSLLEERKGYVARNLPLRVAAVDALLRKLGYNLNAPETASIENAVETAVAPKAKRKRAE